MLFVKWCIWRVPRKIFWWRIVHRSSTGNNYILLADFMFPGRHKYVGNSLKFKIDVLKIFCELASRAGYVCQRYCQHGNICLCNLILVCRWLILLLPFLICYS